ncbi:MAG TPA: DUF4157 domain-containing protein, partial [Polyangia bacterium]|nr:DUF4157 domain-containing protein [Polyangia bacterium]
MSSFMLPVRRPAKPEPKKKEKDVEGGPGPSPPRGSPPTPFGLPLIAPVRAEMSRRFGEPFDDVRVHTGAEAAARAQSAGAAAYTLGRDVVFGAGRYAPETPDGRGLLTHELAHVVQQRRGAAAASAPPPG